MGNKNSSPNQSPRRQYSSNPNPNPASSPPGWQHNYGQSSVSQYAQTYPTQNPYPAEYAPSQNYGTPPQTQPNMPHNPQMHAPQKKFDRRYSRIADNYNSLEEVTEALGRAGLESSNLIIGIDFTKSNEWTAYTHDQDVFSFYPDERVSNGFEEVLSRYRELVPQLKLAGPTSFAPIIEMAMTVVEQSGGQYHVLLIIADGQVTRSVDTEHGELSPQELKTVQAIVQASKLPLSIILVGVGDGPWDMMREFDDNIPTREFDNFQFVNFTEIMTKNVPQNRKETEFALSALMEIPSQFKATMELHLLGGRKGNIPERIALPPPVTRASFGGYSKPSQTNTSTSYYKEENAAPSAPNSNYEHQICPICLSDPKNLAFGCGHQTCFECGQELQLCPICRCPIQTRIKLY